MRQAAERAREVLHRPADVPARLRGPWAAEQRRELETIRLRGLETLAEAGLRRGGRELGAAEQAARSAIAAAPFRESAHRLLMEVHEAAGNPAEALRAFEELRSCCARSWARHPAWRRWRSSSASCAASRLPRTARRARHRRPGDHVAAPWPPPLAAAVERHALVGRARELANSSAAGARRRRPARARPARGRRRDRQDPQRRGAGGARRDDGALVLYGRFDEETLTPYQPVVEMVRGWSAGAPLDSLRERLGLRAAELGILFPSSAHRPRPPGPGHAARRPTPSASASSTRWRRCSARSAPRRRSCSSSTTSTGPTGRRSSSCATSSAPRRRAARCSSAPTARAEPDRHPLHELIGDLRREACSGGSNWAAWPSPRSPSSSPSSASAPASESFVHALPGETEGNPFFIEEVVRHLRDS